MAVLERVAARRGLLAAVAVGAAVTGLAVPAPAASLPGSAPAPSPSVPEATFTPTLPAPTGPYEIGRTTLHLVDHHRQDPWTPDRARELMATVTYPARHVDRCPAGRWFSPAVAESAEAFLAEPRPVSRRGPWTWRERSPTRTRAHRSPARRPGAAKVGRS